MRELTNDECGFVAGAATCDYADMSTMASYSGAAASTAAMTGFAFGGPTVAGIAGAGFGSAALAAFGVYNFVILVSDLFGGCSGYTAAC